MQPLASCLFLRRGYNLLLYLQLLLSYSTERKYKHRYFPVVSKAFTFVKILFLRRARVSSDSIGLLVLHRQTSKTVTSINKISTFNFSSRLYILSQLTGKCILISGMILAKFHLSAFVLICYSFSFVHIGYCTQLYIF
jgi:hypothetical protein